MDEGVKIPLGLLKNGMNIPRCFQSFLAEISGINKIKYEWKELFN